MTTFNKEDAYNNNIKNIVEELRNACYEAGIPMFLSMALAQTKDSTRYQTETISPDYLDTQLLDDKFPKFINVNNGFDTVYPGSEDVMELEF